ncbi:hypothetical protein Bhyg_10491, partial [Pseudolycoriella hygida]
LDYYVMRPLQNAISIRVSSFCCMQRKKQEFLHFRIISWQSGSLPKVDSGLLTDQKFDVQEVIASSSGLSSSKADYGNGFSPPSQ